MVERLSKAVWVVAGLKALAHDGGVGLKADIIAKQLGVSRGSFYWHFADLDAFHAAVVEAWQDAAVDAVLRLLEGDVVGRLRQLIVIALHADPALEIGMRAWAAGSTRARAAVEEVDARRLDHLARMLAQAGVESEISKARAHVIYWTYLGSALSRAKVEDDVMERLIDELVTMATRGGGF